MYHAINTHDLFFEIGQHYSDLFQTIRQKLQLIDILYLPNQIPFRYSVFFQTIINKRAFIFE